MIDITVENADGDQSTIQAYGVSVTETINAYKTLSFSFVAVGENKVAEGLMGPETLFTLTDGRMFHLTTANPQPTTRFRIYTITATEVGQDVADLRISGKLTGSQSLDNCLKFLTNGSKITYQIDGNVGNHDFGDDGIGASNGEDVLNSIAQGFGVEYYFDNYKLHVAKQIGKDDSFVFVDRVNAAAISWNEDYSDFKTAIHGHGKEIEQNNDNTGGGSANDLDSYARSFVGKVPYVWSGSTTAGWDCSGFVSFLLNHYGLNVGRRNTVGLEGLGQTVGPPYQPGDLLFWGSHGNTSHVSIAVNNGYRVGADNENVGTVYRPIANWPPSFGVRIPALQAKIHGNSDDDSSDTTDTTPEYTCEADYFSPLASKPNIGKRWVSEDYSSETITDANALKAAMKKALHDYPDVQYTLDWVTFKDNGHIHNDIAIGNRGYLRDRYGTDVSVKIQSFTHYLDAESSDNSSITFGNKIFDSALYSQRQQDANNARQQANSSARQNMNNAYTIMTSEEVEKLADYFESTK